ncbi:MAG: DUF4398 domain-containing protein [Alkalispirochaeta sp.]
MKLKKTLHLLFITIIGLAIVSIVSCAQPPEEEMAAAREAVEQAQGNPDVREYAQQSLEDAQQLLAEMESAAENEEYDSARTLAGEAQAAAEQAVEDATNAKASARDRAETSVADATAALEEARTALDDARDVPGLRLDLSATESDLDTSADEVSQAEAAFQEEEYAEAETLAENARASISDTIRRISSAVREASAK